MKSYIPSEYRNIQPLLFLFFFVEKKKLYIFFFSFFKQVIHQPFFLFDIDMGSVYVQNTTTGETFHFFLSRNSARPNDNIKRLTPGSYKIIRYSLMESNTYQFRGLFQIIDQDGNSPIVETLPFRSVAPFFPQYPNFIVSTATDPHGQPPLVILEKIISF